MQKLFSSTLFFSDSKISSQAQAVSQFPFTALLVVAISFFLVHCSFPISKYFGRAKLSRKIFAFGDGVELIFQCTALFRFQKFPGLACSSSLGRGAFFASATVKKLFSSTLFFSDFKISSQAQAVSQFPFTALLVVAISFFLVHCSFPISKFPRRRRPFLNFHTALLMIATGAHTQTKSTSRKKFAFASRKFSPSATVLKFFSSALFFSDFNFFRPSEALARENFPISNISRPRVVLYFLLSFTSSPASRAEVHCPFPISKFFGRAKLSLAKIFRFQIFPGLA